MTTPYGGTDYQGNAVPTTQGSMTPAHSAGIVVAAAIVFLAVVRMGYRDISIGKVTGGLVRA